ncbi:MAG: hypothetical protein M1820_004947 [Bogoriella megaspora]|nr:MAG: hypothetical protein M1820_004947 [Bogoriella megaspora]
MGTKSRKPSAAVEILRRSSSVPAELHAQHNVRMSVDCKNEKVLLAEAPIPKRASSPKRGAVPNFSRPTAIQKLNLDTSVATREEKEDHSPPPPPIPRKMRKTSRAANVKRWDGGTRAYCDWDGLRRDDELWFPNGDCLVHFYNKGQSQRGPSLRVPFESLRQAECDPLLEACLAQMASESPRSSPTGSSTSDDRSIQSGSDSNLSRFPGAKYELYIPSPENIPREEAFVYHITTRNFFAWMFGKPLVGPHLGKSLSGLLERMTMFRSENVDNVMDFTKYLENSGYLDFGHCPDYALAMLYFAEEFELRDLWIDAFVHCVGMNESLCLSPEFAAVSRVSKALITRAYLEMDLHLTRVARSLSTFLEDDFSSTYLGLSEGARVHLDRFRSFLYAYYVSKFGYWPPPQGSGFSKALYRSMYFEFSKLYTYLADMQSSDNVFRSASGGICVLQNVQAFDGRHKYDPLPYPLPLLPAYEGPEKQTSSQKGLRSFMLGSKDSKKDRLATVRSALTEATNSKDTAVTSCPLVKEYARFEREWHARPEEKVSVADTRKVRWLLIYGVVQMLISVTRAAPEVRDNESPSYPLCCLTAGTPPWSFSSKPKSLISSTNSPISPLSTSSPLAALSPEVEVPAELRPQSSISIHPDCETADYFSNISFNRRVQTDPLCVPAPLRPLRSRTNTTASAPVIRTSSIRKNLLIPKRFSSRRLPNKETSKPLKATPFCEILVHGYGNGLNKASVSPSSKSSKSSIDPSYRPKFDVDSRPSSPAQRLEPSAPPSPAASNTTTHEETHPTQSTFSKERAKAARTPLLSATHLDTIHTPVSSSTTASSSPLLSWAEEASMLSASHSLLHKPSHLTLNIYDIASATPASTASTDNKRPASSVSTSSNYSTVHTRNASQCWSEAGNSEASSGLTSVAPSSSGASINETMRRDSNTKDTSPRLFSGRESQSQSQSPSEEEEAKPRHLSVALFAKMLSRDDGSDYGDEPDERKGLSRMDSMESLRGRYVDMDIFTALQMSPEGLPGLED